jgi:hypothetical protein
MSYIGNQPTSVAFLTDQFSGTGSQTAFTLSAAPANTASIIVAVSGVLQDPTTYSTSGLTLTFSAAPPVGTGNISVRFLGIPASNIATTAYRTQTEFTATAGQTTFSVPSYTPGFIDVYRNGVLLGSADFTATNGTTVVLASGATAGDLVETISFFVSSVLNAIPATAGAVTSAYLLDGSVTQAKLAAGVAGNGPLFRARPTSTQTLSHNTTTKINWGNEFIDTNNNFASSTFTPTVAGYYQINVMLDFNITSSRQYYFQNYIYKNGVVFDSPEWYATANAGGRTTCFWSDIVYCNGTTDYIEVYAYPYDYSTSGTVGVQTESVFSGSLVRAA